MILNLSVIVGGLNGWVAVCLFALFTVSDPKRERWMNLPAYVRNGFLFAAIMFVWRSVNLFSLADMTEQVAGQPNREAVFVAAALAYLMTAIMVWRSADIMPPKMWSRVDWVKRELRHDASQAPLLVPISQITDIAHADGLAAVGPGEPPAAAYREAPRLARSHQRAAR